MSTMRRAFVRDSRCGCAKWPLPVEVRFIADSGAVDVPDVVVSLLCPFCGESTDVGMPAPHPAAPAADTRKPYKRPELVRLDPGDPRVIEMKKDKP